MSTDVTRWSLMDERLLQCAAAGMSAEQIEAELDVPGARAIVRIRELLRSRDLWSVEERRQLLLEDMYRLKDDFRRNIDMTDAKHVEAMTKLLERLGNRLDAASEVSNEMMDKITTAHSQRLVQIYIKATERAKEILAEAYPEAILEDIDDALQAGLREAAAEIEA